MTAVESVVDRLFTPGTSRRVSFHKPAIAAYIDSSGIVYLSVKLLFAPITSVDISECVSSPLFLPEVVTRGDKSEVECCTLKNARIVQ
jgi:hypothetical protein